LERARMYEEDPAQVRKIIAEGSEKANQLAEETMRDVRAALGIGYQQ
ncbi:tryptophan--tRNA ligase, partial [Nitrosomonas sp. GH22]|nr:tryptophan--tRNA ligase [Nitrosomonas sp. GH22]